MRSIISFLTALFALVVFTSAVGSPTGNMIVHVKDTDNEKTIALYLANLEKQFTSISIVGLDGRTWHNDYVWNKNGYAINIDLNVLDVGDYLMAITNRSEKAMVALFVTEDRVFYENTNKPGFAFKKETYFKPTPFSRLIAHFYVEGNEPTLNVQLANLNEGATTIRLTNWEGADMFSERFTGEIGYHKAIDLTGLPDDAYYLFLDCVEAKVFQMLQLSKGTLRLGPTMGKERVLLEKRIGVAGRQ